jgi:hypothetical protein
LSAPPGFIIEKGMTVSGNQSVIVSPVDFKLTLGVFAIAPIWFPTQQLQVADKGGTPVKVRLKFSWS